MQRRIVTFAAILPVMAILGGPDLGKGNELIYDVPLTRR
jgi:hypothetical protein